MTRKQLPISQLKRGPIRHEQLPLPLSVRIEHLYAALEEVYPQSLEAWIDEFQRDTNPESEVVWWERLTPCYLSYTEPKELSFKQKQSAFKVLFSLAVGGKVQALNAELGRLPEGAEEEILGLLGGATQ